MATNEGPHDGDRNPKSRPFNSFAERYESTAFCQESSRPSLPPLRNYLPLPLPTNHPLPPLSGPLLPPLTNLTQPNTPPNYQERAISRKPTTNYGVDGFRKAFPMPTDVSSLHAQLHQQDMELQTQRKDLNTLSRCFLWIGHLIDNLQGNIPIRTAPTAFSEIVPGRSSIENTGSLGAQRNGATPSAGTAAPSIHTSFAPSLHSHTPQPSFSHQQPAVLQEFQPAIQEERGTSVSSGRCEHQGQSRGFTAASSSETRYFREDGRVYRRSEVPNLEPARFASSDSRMKDWEYGSAGSMQQFPAVTPSNHSQDGPNRLEASKSSTVCCSLEVKDSINRDNRTCRTAQHRPYSYKRERNRNVSWEEKLFITILKIIGKKSWTDIQKEFGKRFPQTKHGVSRLRETYYLTREEWGLSTVRGRDIEKDLMVVRENVLRTNVGYLSEMMASFS